MTVSRSDDGDAEYTDYEVQNFAYNADLVGGPSDFGEAEARYEVTGPQGLSHDEVAELAVMTFHATHGVEDQDTTTDTEPGTSRGRFIIGIDTDRDDSVAIGGGTPDADAEVTGGGTSGGTPDITADHSTNPAVLEEAQLQAMVGFNDTVTGTGGGSSNSQLARIVNFRELFGTGPFLDSTDEMHIASQINHDQVSGDTNLRITGRWYWRIHELESSRPRFGRR